MAEHPLTKGAPGFYVYQVLVAGVVRYVGKGCGERAREHERTARRIIAQRQAGQKVKTSRFYNRLAKAIAGGACVAVSVVGVWDDEGDAIAAERRTIAAAPKGELWNTLPGGEGFDSAFIKALWADPAYRERMSAASKARWDDPDYRANQAAVRAEPEHRARMSRVLIDALADPAVRAKMSARKREAMKDPEARKRMGVNAACGRTPEKRRRDSDRLKMLWADPEWRAATMEAQRRGRADPEVRRARSESAKAQHTSESRRRASEVQKANWMDAEYRARHLASRRAPEVVAKISASRQKYLDDPEWRKKLGEAVRAGKAAARRAKCST